MVKLVLKPQGPDADIPSKAHDPAALEGVRESPPAIILGLQRVISGLRGSTPPGVVGKAIEGWGPQARRSIDSVLSRPARSSRTHSP